MVHPVPFARPVTHGGSSATPGLKATSQVFHAAPFGFNGEFLGVGT